MGPTSTAVDRCPQCRGLVRPGAPWCTQCWADLRPAPEPEPEPEAVHALVPPPAAVPDGELRPAAKGWPCSGCGHPNAVELDACAACGTPFLAGLRGSEPPLLELPVVGDLTRLSRGQRLGLAGGVVVLVVLLTALVSLLLS